MSITIIEMLGDFTVLKTLRSKFVHKHGEFLQSQSQLCRSEYADSGHWPVQ